MHRSGIDKQARISAANDQHRTQREGRGWRGIGTRKNGEGVRWKDWRQGRCGGGKKKKVR